MDDAILALPTRRAFPDEVPTLVDPVRGVRLRAADERDIDGMVEQSNDPEVVTWTTIPTLGGDYGRSDAEAYLGIVRVGWESGGRLSWTIEVTDRSGGAGPRSSPRALPRYAGGIDLRIGEHGLAEVGFVLHPRARGQGVAAAALRLVRDYGFDAAGVKVLRWRALVGNWPSRRVAAAAGFHVDGTVRSLLWQRGGWRDGWVATLRREDPRTPLSWNDTPELRRGPIRLRSFTADDTNRIVEACADPRTRHWLVSMPQPYGRDEAASYLEGVAEMTARNTGHTWCLADATDDRCLGSISLEGLGGYSRRAEIGYWTHPEARARGLMRLAVVLVSDWAERSDLVDSILIRCAAGNTASRYVAEASGYTQIGVQPRCEPLGDGTLADLVSYARP